VSCRFAITSLLAIAVALLDRNKRRIRCVPQTVFAARGFHTRLTKNPYSSSSKCYFDVRREPPTLKYRVLV
jgi:hypothetical protein